MNSEDELPVPPPAPAQRPTPLAWDSGLEKFAVAYLADRRSERRWRLFFRLAWLGVFVVLAWLLFASRNHVSAPSGPHTALIEVRGEIAVDTEASA